MLHILTRIFYSHNMTHETTHDMITIKRIGLFVIIASFFPAPFRAAAEPGGYSFSLSPLTGIVYGHSEEIVYKKANSNLYLSELLWDLKPLVYAGAAMDFEPEDLFSRHGFISAASIKVGLPLKTGILEDRDWFNPEHDYLTHYSRHDAYSRMAILADISAGFSFRLSNFIALGLYGEFSYMRFSWSGKDGYLQYPVGTSENYPPWNESLPKDYESSKGEVIRYAQNWFILAPGISIKGKLGSLFSVEGNFNYSPLIYCANRDDHLLANRVFFDYPYLGHYFKGGGVLIFSPMNKMDLTLNVSYKYITGSRGDNFINNRKYADIAGAGYSALDMGITARFYIFGR